MDRILTVYEISTLKSIMCVLLLKPLGSGLFFTFKLIYGISYLLLVVCNSFGRFACGRNRNTLTSFSSRGKQVKAVILLYYYYSIRVLLIYYLMYKIS